MAISSPRFRCFNPTNSYPATPDHPPYFPASTPNDRSSGSMAISDNCEPKITPGPCGYVLEDVPHFVDYIPYLLTYYNPLQDNPSYSVVKQYFVNVDDTVSQKIVVHKDSPRGTHFRRSRPRQKCILSQVKCILDMYGVKRILGIEGGYRGFYARNTIPLKPKVVNDIHKRGGTILGTS